MKPVSTARLFTAFLSALLLHFPVWAADVIDEITVLADLRERTAKEVPASITVLDSEEIESMAVQHFE